ncbi:MAG: hypothetical protein AMXMBFR22_29410 [Phycisphaerae bacterium]
MPRHFDALLFSQRLLLRPTPRAARRRTSVADYTASADGHAADAPSPEDPSAGVAPRVDDYPGDGPTDVRAGSAISVSQTAVARSIKPMFCSASARCA